jgi:ribosomal protein S24E
MPPLIRPEDSSAREAALSAEEQRRTMLEQEKSKNQPILLANIANKLIDGYRENYTLGRGEYAITVDVHDYSDAKTDEDSIARKIAELTGEDVTSIVVQSRYIEAGGEGGQSRYYITLGQSIT